MKSFRKIFQISLLKTLRLNFHYFPLKIAIRCPILLSRSVNIRSLKGSVVFNGPVNTGMVRFGFDTTGIVDFKYQRSVWENNGMIEINGVANFGPAMKLIVLNSAKLSLGKVTFSGSSKIITGKHISFGDECLISWDNLVMDTDFHKIFNKSSVQTNLPKEIHIGNHVWIGCNCLILKGGIIPSDSVIAANSLINKKLENENSVYGGNPVRMIKQDIIWER